MSGKSCTISFKDSNLSKQLRRKVGKDDKRYVEYQSAIINSNDDTKFDDNFASWYKQKYNREPNLDVKNAAVLADRVIEYYNKEIIKSASRNVIGSKTLNLGNTNNYGNAQDREDGKKFCADIILQVNKLLKDNNIQIKGNAKEYYANQLKNIWNRHIFEEIARIKNKTVAEVKDDYNSADDKYAFINKAFGKDKTINQQNLLAVYSELNGTNNHLNAYLDEVFANRKLNNIRGEIRGENVDINENNAIDANSDLEGENKEDKDMPSDDNFDRSISNLNNHIGTYSDWKKHLSPRITQYFDTLPKLATPGKKDGNYDVDRNNRFGIATTMNAAECANMLYSTASFGNKTMMIESIRRIGETTVGFEAFVKLADDLEADQDFATELFTVFAKTIMNKIETVVQDGKSFTRVSNSRVSKQAAMIFDGINNLRNIIPSVDVSLFEVRRQNITRAVRTYRKRKNYSPEVIDALTRDISNLIRQFFPNISDDAIRSYIENNRATKDDGAAMLNNIGDLALLIKETIDNIPNSIAAYASKQTAISNAIRYNDNIRADHDSNGNLHDRSEYVDLQELYKSDFITPELKTAVFKLMTQLQQYATVSIDLNSRNVYGNLSSDIINNSFITRFTKALKEFYTEYDDSGTSRVRNKQLEDWAKQKFKTSQYEYSNIFIEHRDEDGKIINKGLFRQTTDGSYVLTEYAPELLETYLFNGASNMDENNNATYNKMNSGDYFPTAFINFFKTEVNGRTTSEYGNYFLRIPSDAPKTFVIRAPRYNTWGLYAADILDPYSESARTLNNLVNNYDRITLDDWRSQYSGEIQAIELKANARESTNDQVIKAITNQGDLYVPDIRAARIINEETGEAYVTYGVRNQNGKDEMYVFKGTLVKRGKANFLINREFTGVVSSTGEVDLKENIKDGVTNYYREQLQNRDITYKGVTYEKSARRINVFHPVFQLVFNNFKQELIDMAKAIDTYFELNADDSIKLVNGKPVFKAGMSNTYGYKFYHLGKNGTVLDTIKQNGRTIYKLAGKVFTSNKFTLNIEVDGHIQPRNFMSEIFSDEHPDDVQDKGMIHLFYGGRDSNGLGIVRDSNGKIVDVTLNAEQQNKVEDALREYLTEYCNQAINKTNRFKDFIKDVNLSVDNIVDFAVNNLIMHYTYDDIFEGNTKFYADSQTILKRAKEVQGSGVPYGISDYMDMNSEEPVEVVDSYLNSGVYNGQKIQDIFKGTVLDGVTQRTGFKAVTIKNSINTNFVALKELRDQLVKNGLSVDKADDLLYGSVEHDAKGRIVYEDKEKTTPKRKGGFTNTKVNDAQSYITFKEWVRRVAARGQLKRYMPLIQKLLDENSILTADDITEFVQVQKNFYYDLHYDNDFNIEAPRQIKNAEFVLVPRFIKGTQLERVAQMMEEAGIDQLNTVETSKASNKNILTLWDNDGNISEERYDNFANEARNVADNYYYNYLYTQQETQQHVNDENKAGIQIVKKILDNLKDGIKHPKAIQFFSNYIANIEETYTSLLHEFQVETDENGNIVLDENGNIPNIDKEVFYDRLKEELFRTGINSNMLDYVTIDETTGDPIAPPVSNLVLSKFETTIQSIFNNRITRQRLPGFHAAQVTNIGWSRLDNGESQYCLKTDSSKIISKEQFNNLPNEEKSKYRNTKVNYDGNLRYHPDGKGYIEVKLTYSMLGINKNDAHYRGMTNEEIIAELEKEGLDKVIGYRIPTEGKQSICVMKVADFIDDGLGSTIIVPNDWVSQTGSDFDIDSVYGIQYNTYKTSNGQLHKVKDVDHNNATMFDWFNYIEHFGENVNTEKIGGKIKKALDKINAELNERFEELSKLENEAFGSLMSVLGNNAKTVRQYFFEGANRIKKRYPDASKREIYSKQLNGYKQIINKLLNKKITDAQRDAFNAYLKTVNNLINFLDGQTEQYANQKDNAITQLYQNKIDEYNEIAKDAGLLSFDDYFETLEFGSPYDVAKIRTKSQRNNQILDAMIDILEDPENLEENLSRSNFDKITEALNDVLSLDFKTERINRSPYNIFDEIEYQEEAMSGAELKAFSVTLDTFCSVCNMVKPTLQGGIKVIYNNKNYNESEIKNRYTTKKAGKEKFSIVHDQYGWSNDNRNIEGMILTSYSSQTTAYILDAIKEGAIPNVNRYTFSAFKTLVNLGIDYKTAVAFITNPAINRILENNIKFNSIYSTEHGNPIEESIRQIARELGLASDVKMPVQALLKSIQSKYGKTIDKLFKCDDAKITLSLNAKESASLPIDVAKLRDRINNKGTFKETTPVEEKLLFDLGNILIFNRLRYLSNEIQSIARCCNPDRFGAKQTVFLTDEVFNNIQSILFDEDSGIRKPKENILEINGQNILQAIYPGCENGIYGILKSDVQQSAYPSLAAFLKYASATSSIINKQVLLTQHPAFVSLCRGLSSIFSNINMDITEDMYKDFQAYALCYLYNQVPSITKPINYILNEDGTYSRKIDGEADSLAETQRIYGYGIPASLDIVVRETINNLDGTTRQVNRIVPFEVENINHPTQDDINRFAQLSPAQKAEWIRRNFDEQGIFEFLNIELYNGANRGWRVGMQTIEFTEDKLDANVAFDLFYAAYYNENPLVSMAAQDLIKYAVQVEGLKMRQRGISKIIDNQPLIDSFADGGLGFFDYIKEQFGTMDTMGSPFYDEGIRKEIYEKYLRSHPDMPAIKSFRFNGYTAHSYNIGSRKYDMLVINKPNDKTKTAEENDRKYNANLTKLGIRTHHALTDTYTTNKYVRVFKDGKKIIYKINDLGNQIILYPLNTLNSNEVTDYSSYKQNNFYPHQSTFETIISEYAKIQDDAKFTSAWVGELTRNQPDIVKRYKYPKDYSKIAESKPFNLDVEAQEGGAMSILKNIIENHFKNSNTDLYVRNIGLSNRIFTPGATYGVQQVVTFSDGTKHSVIICKVNNSKLDKKLLGSDDKNVNQANIDQLENETLRAVYTNANEQGLKHISDLYVVLPNVAGNSQTPVVGSMQSTLEESNYAVSEFARSQSARGDELALSMTSKFKLNGINNTKTSIAENREIATREIAEYVNKKVKELRKDFTNFIPDPTDPDSSIGILDPRVQDMLAKDDALLNRYMKVINEAEALQKTLSIYNELLAPDENAITNMYINSIKDNLDKLVALNIDEAQKALARGWATKISTNPLIKSTFLDILDGFYKTYGSMWRFHDIAENGNPLLQTILLDVQGDIEAKRMMSIRRKSQYRKRINEIISEAKRHGQNVDINKIVDDEGNFNLDIDKKGIEKLDELREKKNNAANEFGYGSIEHLKAKNEYDLFLAHHFNQEAKPEYYINKANNEKIMIEQYPVLYSEYMKLHYRRLDLLRSNNEFGMSEEVRTELENINQQIRNLTRPGIYFDKNGNITQRIDPDPNITYSEEVQRELDIYSRKSQAILYNFIKSDRELKDKYFGYDAVYGFEENLKRNLQIVESFERRDGNGIPTVPADVLEANEQYVEARNWIRDNARFVIVEDQSEGSLYSKLMKAIERLSLTRNGKNVKVSEYLRNSNKGKGIRDAYGIMDGTRLTKKEIADIKRIMEEEYGTRNMPVGSDRILINSIGKARTQVFSSEFYKGMSSGKVDNPAYLKTVGSINRILEKYYSDIDGVVHFDKIPDTEEGIKELQELALLLNQLKAIKKENQSDPAVADFIKKNVEFVTEKDIYLSQLNAAKEKSQEYQEAWMRVNLEYSEDGRPIITKEGKMIPNRFLYSYAKPKGKPGDASYDNFVDKQRSEDLNLVESIYRKVATKYYYQAMREALRKSQEDKNFSYAQWYAENHVYNPYTRKYEPLPCWTMNEVRNEEFADREWEGQWIPNIAQRERKVKDGKERIVVNGEEIESYNPELDMRNKDYKPGLTRIDNYVKGSQHGEYDNSVTLNEYEKQMRDYLKQLIQSLCYLPSAQRFFERGKLPIEAANEEMTAKSTLKELSKIIGFNISTNNGTGDYYSELGYDMDRTPLMPMTKLLKSKQTNTVTTIEEAEQYLDSDTSINFQVQRPSRTSELDGRELQDAISRYDEVARKVREHNAKISQGLMNKNWYDVVERFIDAASHYNAVQDNKEKLYYLLSMLQKQRHYMREFGLTGHLKKDSRHITEDNRTSYEQSVDKDLLEQYQTFMRRILFDQWKQTEGRMTKAMNNLQGFVSANYMMLNVRGGIANVTLGETGILAEALAGEYFKSKHLSKGHAQWIIGSISFAQGAYRETSTSKQDAITKFFKAVDYDEVTGRVKQVGLKEWSERIRDFGYSPQSVGEHLMQNSVLFAMLYSHKIVPVVNDPRGIGFTIMTEDEYIANGIANNLGEILTEEQIVELNSMIAKIKEDADKLKDYAWYRKDPVGEYVATHCTKEQVNEYHKKRKELKEKLSKEFNEKQSLFDQMELGQDGYLSFVNGSDLSKLDELEYNGITQALDLLGRFSERVRKVNNKIHGVYNRLGSADIEKSMLGGLIMQYHKHLPFGILKRYKARGYYSEFRGTREKGMVQSVWDVLTLNARRIHREGMISQDEANALEAFQNTMKSIIPFILELPTTWKCATDYDKANIRRNLGDAAGVLGAFFGAVALYAIGQQDDDTGILYNLAIYEMDRLGSEAFMYNPIGAVAETKKLMSTPIAAQSIVTDILQGSYQLCNMILLGDEYDGIYHSGRFAGESKLGVYFQRRIPIWNGIRNIIDIEENNRYYKVGTTGSTIFNYKSTYEWLTQ